MNQPVLASLPVFIYSTPFEHLLCAGVRVGNCLRAVNGAYLVLSSLLGTELFSPGTQGKKMSVARKRYACTSVVFNSLRPYGL